MKKSAISFRVSDDIKAALEKAAEDDARSVSSFVQKVLTDHLRASGHLPH